MSTILRAGPEPADGPTARLRPLCEHLRPVCDHIAAEAGSGQNSFPGAETRRIASGPLGGKRPLPFPKPRSDEKHALFQR